MDLWQLKVFVNVIKEKSFSRAGETIFLSQPTVSSHIKDLENHFGCRLIDRLGREAVPTKAGELLYEHAMKMLQLQEKTETALSHFLGHARGRLTIGGSTIPAGYIIPRIIGPFNRRHPDISLSVMTRNSARIIEKVLKGDVEVGVVGAKSTSPQIQQEKILKDEMKLIVPAGHAWSGLKEINRKQLTTVPFLARTQGSGTWDAVTRSMKKADMHPDRLNVIATLGSTAAVIQAILNHAGVSILSPIAVADEIQHKRLFALEIEGLNLTRHFFVTTHSKRTCSPLALLFIKFIKACYKTPEI
ncbi:transcriptional regulator, LysR family [Desulfocicer vacuolatum DSM 3385]|uniref:Transcriptional regulator, LysR family n=1 Tax=Desulfocicer vacuolatum DSM 3385 TaxID=1121400 RepID=A0A1W1ZUB3_9BACT|nr:selenium metabolism-associated LysR family transcriptional regulator [Desulfocicer vacuolatum]SMC51822.1 transcriptional regulator, LysR family [Desulfocicer vacuolatum DSM 3385]